MSFVCDRVGLENILLGFDLYKCPCFSIWQGKDLKFAFVSDNIDEARDILEQNLLGLHEASTALYKIKLYKTASEKTGEIDRNTPEVGSFTFRMGSGEHYRNSLPTEQKNDNAIVAVLALIKEQQAQNIEQMRLMNERLDNIGGIEDTGPDELDRSILGQIGTAVERYPALKELAERGFVFLEKIVDKILPNESAQNQYSEPIHSKQVAGISIPQSMAANEKITAVIHEIIKAETPAQSAEKLEQLSEALRVLVERDADLLNSLVGLSQLTQKRYNLAKSFL